MSGDRDARPEPGYDPRTGTYHAYHTRADDDVCETVIRAVAAVTGDDPRELSTPLNDRIDPDALNGIFTHIEDATYPSEEYVAFVVNDLRVRVHGDGHVVVTPP